MRPWYLFAALLLVGCSGSDDKDATTDSGTHPDAREQDASTDAGVVDTGPVSDVGPVHDAGFIDAGTDPRGFSIRVPMERIVPCVGCGTIRAYDVDHVCTLVWPSWDHYIYVQARPESMLDFAGFIYAVEGAWLSDGQTVTDITDAVYDWGGNHHNDSITINLPTQSFRYYHSTFGPGWRACQPPDCLEVYQPGLGALVEDGCTVRTLPIVCVKVENDGTVPPLTDNFQQCQ